MVIFWEGRNLTFTRLSIVSSSRGLAGVYLHSLTGRCLCPPFAEGAVVILATGGAGRNQARNRKNWPLLSGRLVTRQLCRKQVSQIAVPLPRRAGFRAIRAATAMTTIAAREMNAVGGWSEPTAYCPRATGGVWAAGANENGPRLTESRLRCLECGVGHRYKATCGWATRCGHA